MQKKADGIILIAKQSGITSFSSLWQIKNALGTKKIGHTGTLDTFADGLLVALSGSLTRLAPCITGCDKEYLASIIFGTETDTLDPDGIPIRQANLPFYSALLDVLPSLCGTIMQKPPAYSALHVDGQRASDRMRKGEEVIIPARQITVHSLEIIGVNADDGRSVTSGSRVARLDLRIACSKGTYIRSIARDLACAAGSAAFLGNLRRTRIGPFSLDDAAGNSMLQTFAISKPAMYGKGEKPRQVPPDEILEKVQSFTRDIAVLAGIQPVNLLLDKAFSFRNGQHPDYSWFDNESRTFMQLASAGTRFAVFTADTFVGVISTGMPCFTYDFVIGESL